MARNEAQQRSSEHALTIWRNILLKDKPQSAAAIARTLGILSGQGWHYTELAQFKAQMQNGVACPGEFGVNSETNVMKRA